MADNPDDLSNLPWTILQGVLTTVNLTPWQGQSQPASVMPVSYTPSAAPLPQSFANVPAQPASSPQQSVPVPQVTSKPDLPAPSDQVQRLIDCIPTQTDAPFQISETSGNHEPGNPHTNGLAMDVKAQAAYRAALMPAAANCGAAYQQDEYAHPSAHAIGNGHLHFQIPPGLHTSVGPYYPQIRPTARPSS